MMSRLKNSRTIWQNVWLSLASLLLLLPLTAAGQSSDWSITNFAATYEVADDASMQVTETISVNFAVEKHGIFRDIPFRYGISDGKSVTVPIDQIAIKRDGEPEPFERSTIGNNIDLKIGDADVTISGPHVYEISYRVRAVINFFEDHDELYWNVTGSDWEVPIEDVIVDVRLPGGLTADQIRVGCFTGAVGSRAGDCVSTVRDGGLTYTAEDFLTIVVGMPAGTITKPSNYDSIRQGAQRAGQLPWVLIDSPFKIFGNIVLPIGALIGLIWWWRRNGRDPKTKGTIIAHYEPPLGVTPGEMGVIIDEHANHQDIVATMINLAVNGYLEITELKRERLLGLGSSVDYELSKTTPTKAAELKPYEQKLLQALFVDGDKVKLSELKGKIYKDIKTAESDLYEAVVVDGYFYRNPQTVRGLYLGIGIAIGALGVWIVSTTFIFGLIIVGLMLVFMARTMPQRTAKGIEAVWQTRGFKLFLEKAEKYRLQWQEKQNIFEQYLPYAMVLGVADKWSKAFEGIQQVPPSWYHGSDGTFNSIMLWSALNNFSTVTTNSFSPPASSGGSGFGGGGFSGGGFGGGGGGSW